MRKLIAVGVLVGGLLAGAGPASAQWGDPLTLAASGVLLPFITVGGTSALVEVASPVGWEGGGPIAIPLGDLGLHMVFFNTTCDRIGSASLPLTTNDIGFVDIAPTLSPLSTNGLVAIADTILGNELIRLQNPIHSRVYLFNLSDGRSRMLEPITVDTAEAPGITWNPLRTGATFNAPLETGTVKTVLTLICPRSTIQNASTLNLGIFPINAGTIPQANFPAIFPGFNNGTTPMSGRVYDTNEILLRDINFRCDCLTEISVVTFTGGTIYASTSDPANGIGATLGTYTELEVTNPNPDTGGQTRGVFTGYRSSSTVGSALNNFFGRISNGARVSIQGVLTPGTR